MTDDSLVKYGRSVDEWVKLVKEQFPDAIATAEEALTSKDSEQESDAPAES